MWTRMTIHWQRVTQGLYQGIVWLHMSSGDSSTLVSIEPSG